MLKWLKHSRLVLAPLAAVLVISLGACGSEEEPTTTPAQAESDQSAAGDDTLGAAAKLMGPPPVDETVDDAVKRIEEILGSGDCGKINELNPLGRPALATEQRCEVLKRLEGLEVVDAQQFGKLGGIIGYQRGVSTLNAILVRDSDGLLHIATIDPFTGESATAGEFETKFKQVAEQGTVALAERDCEGFLEVAYRRFGIGGGDDGEVCDRVENNVVAVLLERGGDPKPVDLDGGGSYAFFGVDTPASYITLIAARQSEQGLPETLPTEIAELPKGAPEYGIVDALRTNPREPIKTPGDAGDEASDESSG